MGDTSYDEYDSAVVLARNEEEARRIHPQGWDNPPDHFRDTWVPPEQVEVTLVGRKNRGYKPAVDEPGYYHSRIVCASFNAG